MSVSYYIRIVIGQHVDLDDFFTYEEGVISCNHNPDLTAVFCPKCGKKIERGETNHQPTTQAKKLFGDDVNFADLYDEARDADPHTEKIHPHTEKLQLVNTALTGDSDADYVLGIYIMHKRIPESTSDIGAINASPKAIAAYVALAEAKLREAGIEPKVEIFVAPYISY
jgi:hypothetical protein